MAVINIEYYSEDLGMNRKVNVIYPESSKVEDLPKQIFRCFIFCME